MGVITSSPAAREEEPTVRAEHELAYPLRVRPQLRDQHAARLPLCGQPRAVGIAAARAAARRRWRAGGGAAKGHPTATAATGGGGGGGGERGGARLARHAAAGGGEERGADRPTLGQTLGRQGGGRRRAAARRRTARAV